jgi:energy-coupling factor transporter ATP-binding protein EcfA2
MPIQGERETALAFFARLLNGQRSEKKFLVLTDRRSGNNGKTTLVNLIMRFYELDSGRITLDGRDIASFPRNELRSEIEGKVVPQSVKLPLAIVEDPDFKDGENFYSEQSDNFFVGNSFPTCGIEFTAQEIMGQSEANQ